MSTLFSLLPREVLSLLLQYRDDEEGLRRYLVARADPTLAALWSQERFAWFDDLFSDRSRLLVPIGAAEELSEFSTMLNLYPDLAVRYPHLIRLSDDFESDESSDCKLVVGYRRRLQLIETYPGYFSGYGLGDLIRDDEFGLLIPRLRRVEGDQYVELLEDSHNWGALSCFTVVLHSWMAYEADRNSNTPNDRYGEPLLAAYAVNRIVDWLEMDSPHLSWAQVKLLERAGMPRHILFEAVVDDYWLVDEFCRRYAYKPPHEILHRTISPASVWILLRRGLKFGDCCLSQLAFNDEVLLLAHDHGLDIRRVDWWQCPQIDRLWERLLPSFQTWPLRDEEKEGVRRHLFVPGRDRLIELVRKTHPELVDAMMWSSPFLAPPPPVGLRHLQPVRIRPCIQRLPISPSYVVQPALSFGPPYPTFGIVQGAPPMSLPPTTLPALPPAMPQFIPQSVPQFRSPPLAAPPAMPQVLPPPLMPQVLPPPLVPPLVLPRVPTPPAAPPSLPQLPPSPPPSPERL